MTNIHDIVWDVAVIGGGPAGMMAAGRAAERGERVIILEKNPSLGKKLLITGGGRCNVTNAEPDQRKFLAHYRLSHAGKNGANGSSANGAKNTTADKYLFSAFDQWNAAKTIGFFESRGVPTKVEPGNRVFPASNRAQSIFDALAEYIKKGNVTIETNAHVVGFKRASSVPAQTEPIDAVALKGGRTVRAKSFILATGGASHPETGSTGDGFAWLKSLGHSISEPTPSLVPIALSDTWIKSLQGVTLPQAKLTLAVPTDSKGGTTEKIIRRGKVLFTHFGISGPTVLNMSSAVDEALRYADGEVVIELDVVPTLDYAMLNAKLQELFKTHSNKKFKNALDELIMPALTPVIAELATIEPNTACNSVTREQRLRLVQALKHIKLHVAGLLGADKAIITSGGVSLDEVDFKTMRSRLVPNLFLVGDLLDIDRPSGGYSLQLCWTTGFVAGDTSFLN